jgi:benzoyl-CoA reductase/2-hydroxyglutaryl-CoA dehydratase subunit BcrC/BadD/HgdB
VKEMSEKKSKMLKATQGLKNAMGRHYLAIEQAYRDGKPTAWASSGTPVELLYAMDVQPMLPENSATISAAQKYSQGFIELAEQEGFSYDMCSYFKTNVGAVMEDVDVFKGGIKKPTLMLSSDVICDTHVHWFQVQAERFGGVPHYTIDVPHVVSNTSKRQRNYYKKYVEEQMWELLEFIKEHTGNEIDMEKAKKVAGNSYELSVVWKDIYELRKNVPSPISTKDTFGGLFPLFTQPGLRPPINLYKRMYREAKARVDAGVGALENEEFRLVFEGIPFWHSLRYFAMLERYNAIIVYEPYTFAFSKFFSNPFEVITKERLLKDPIECMSSLMLSFWYIFDLETRIDWFQKTVKDWKADGIIFHDNVSCRPNTAAFYDLKRRLTEEYDIPCLIISADQNDVRKFNEEQVTNQIESFIEVLRARKKR